MHVPAVRLGPGDSAARRGTNPFSSLHIAGNGTRSCEASWRLAREMTVLLGPHAPVVEAYHSAMSMAPPHHLAVLRRRSGCAVFGPTIPAVLSSDWAAERRGRRLSAHELWDLRMDYSLESRTAAAYDPELDALVLPTSYVTRDIERVVLHELGHAMTMHAVVPRQDLLRNLPGDIAHHVASYGDGSDARSIRVRAEEALAEAYVFVVVGRHEELPATLLSELLVILSIAEEDAPQLSFGVDAGMGP